MRTARTFLRVRGAASPQRSSMNSRRRFVPVRRLESGELEVGVIDRELGEDRLVVAQRLGGRAVLVPEPADEVGDLETDRRRPVGLSFTASRMIRAASPSVKLRCVPFEWRETWRGTIETAGTPSATSKSAS
jgi:hypothetical protein